MVLVIFYFQKTVFYSCMILAVVQDFDCSDSTDGEGGDEKQKREVYYSICVRLWSIFTPMDGTSFAVPTRIGWVQMVLGGWFDHIPRAPTKIEYFFFKIFSVF